MIYIIGIGPGGTKRMTLEAIEALRASDIIVGYKPYLSYVSEYIKDKETFSTGMTGEIERCKKALELEKAGNIVSVISTGDAGQYGMAGPILELMDEGTEYKVIPGVSAQYSAASELGAPIMHDVATISLSDLLTPYDLIMNRVRLASEGDFVISLYNPRSKSRVHHLEEAISIIRKYRDDNTPVGIVKNSGRDDTKITLTTIDSIEYEKIDMMTIVIVGNSKSYIKNDIMITPRGYENK